MLEEVLEGRSISSDTKVVLENIIADLSDKGCRAQVKQRGHFGKVIRFHRNDVFLFDALPARNWVRFYFSAKASKLPAFHWERTSQCFPEAEQRPKDHIVSIRLHDPQTAAEFCAFLGMGLGGVLDQ